MRRIEKQAGTPDCLSEFIELQLQSGPPVVNLCYPEFKNPGKKQLHELLTREQFGICGYTGAPIDERIENLQVPRPKIAYSNHIEHLKCQEACKAELDAAGLEYGCDLCDDLAYHNMIAALEVRGVKEEHFGAVYKADNELRIWPTQDGCEERFRFHEVDGGVSALDPDAKHAVEVLHLNHDTLKGWRKAALDSFLDPEVIVTREDFERVVQAVEQSSNDKLPEFSFVIASVAKQYLEA
ncbi:hypothetical protein [Arenicella xantha]|uniref:Uncharacterized protein (TIGR02646 family) n=1 Tax=Arenicella xantha TaxID=644221 RepID=A0A395JMP2_9GAMM|nr:hypothetical protein [Arenicella xantha]RBP52900.1 uncharacterized protein (TIGR02646 family) [Arenicella xantha]